MGWNGNGVPDQSTFTTRSSERDWEETAETGGSPPTVGSAPWTMDGRKDRRLSSASVRMDKYRLNSPFGGPGGVPKACWTNGSTASRAASASSIPLPPRSGPQIPK